MLTTEIKEKTLRERALGLLARREHSAKQLATKLLQKGFASSQVSLVVQQLQAEGLQSDSRFAENYVHARSQRGDGPQKIRQQLHLAAVDEEIISASLERISEERWFELLQQVHRKRFGGRYPTDYHERGKQMQFLQMRGFSVDQIKTLFTTQE